jgi:hypothetical protein
MPDQAAERVEGGDLVGQPVLDLPAGRRVGGAGGRTGFRHSIQETSLAAEIPLLPMTKQKLPIFPMTKRPELL